MISGTEIAAARQRAGISQKALADLLGTDIKTVNNWETGRTRPRQVEAVRAFIRLHPPEGVAPLALISDEELLREIADRFARARTKEGDDSGTQTSTKKTDDNPTAEVIEGNFAGPDPTGLIDDLAADRPGTPSGGQIAREDQDKDAAENQDPEPKSDD